MPATLLRLRYPATCASCGAPLPKGTQAHWSREERRATCLSCLNTHAELASAAPDLFDLSPQDLAAAAKEPAVKEVPLVEAPVLGPEIDRGEAGASAAREWTRRHDKREQAVRNRYGKLAGVVLALSDDPHSTNAWAYGANGEHAVGNILNPLGEQGLGVLHDRRIPRSRANIDHIVVAPYGVVVIDAKNYKGRVERRDRGGLFSTDYRLYVGGRDKTQLVAGMQKQAEAVRVALGVPPEEIPIRLVAVGKADPVRRGAGAVAESARQADAARRPHQPLRDPGDRASACACSATGMIVR